MTSASVTHSLVLIIHTSSVSLSRAGMLLSVCVLCYRPPLHGHHQHTYHVCRCRVPGFHSLCPLVLAALPGAVRKLAPQFPLESVSLDCCHTNFLRLSFSETESKIGELGAGWGVISGDTSTEE